MPTSQNTYAKDHNFTFMQAISSITGRSHAEFLRLLFWHAHRKSEELFKLTGQPAQPNQDLVFSKRTAFFNSLKVGHVMAKTSAQRVSLNLVPTVPFPSLRVNAIQVTAHWCSHRTHPGERLRRTVHPSRLEVTLNAITASLLFVQNPLLLWLSQPSLKGSTF